MLRLELRMGGPRDEIPSERPVDRPSTGDGDITGSGSAAELAALLHSELRAVAARVMRGESPGHSLQPTALVHEAFLRLSEQRNVAGMSREAFFAAAATVMRRVLVDHARGKRRAKRGRGWTRVAIEPGDLATPEAAVDLVVLSDAVEALARRSHRQARIVELRFFAGLDMTEIAGILGVSRQTAQEEWRFARAWLAEALAASAAEGADLRPDDRRAADQPPGSRGRGDGAG